MKTKIVIITSSLLILIAVGILIYPNIKTALDNNLAYKPEPTTSSEELLDSEVETDTTTVAIDTVTTTEEKVYDSVPETVKPSTETVYLYANTVVNLRKDPSIESEILETLSINDKVELIEDGDWIKVRYENNTGYIKSEYLSKEKVEIPEYPACFEVQDGYDLEVSKEIVNYYYMIPENVRNHFENSDWKIVLYSGSLEDKYGFTVSIRACTDVDEHTIYLNNKEDAKNSIIHEMGHYIEYVNDWPDDLPECAEVQNAEVEIFRDETGANNANTQTTCEYFAEAYYQFILDPSLKDKCPTTYEFVMRYSNAL